MDVSDLADPRLTRFYTSGTKYSGPWGRGGVAKGPNGTVIAQTADGFYDPASGDFGESVLKLAPKARDAGLIHALELAFSNAKDLDLGSASQMFSFPEPDAYRCCGKRVSSMSLMPPISEAILVTRRPHTNHRAW